MMVIWAVFFKLKDEHKMILNKLSFLYLNQGKLSKKVYKYKTKINYQYLMM